MARIPFITIRIPDGADARGWFNHVQTLLKREASFIRKRGGPGAEDDAYNLEKTADSAALLTLDELRAREGEKNES